MIFYFSLFVFIISLITGLVLMIAGKNMRRSNFMLLATIHLIFFLAFIASLILRKEKTDTNFFFMSFICSGIVLSGLSWRSDSPMPLRIYFSIFLVTIPMFLFSPSMLLNFLLTMNYSSTTGPSFHLADKYFLEQQTASKSKDDSPIYKVVLKRGIFHQTIRRDISFNGNVDSVKVLSYENGQQILLRGYTSVKSFVSVEVDSTDAQIPLQKNPKNEIQYHL